MTAIACPTCSTPDLTDDDLCHCRYPICITCCGAGEHDWYSPNPWRAA